MWHRVRRFLWGKGIFVLTVFVNGPLPEEFGWRGYALDQLQRRWDATVSSLVLGLVWALWHAPLFFIKDMVHARHGLLSAWSWLFFTGVVAITFVYTGIFSNTRHSTLAAIVFHFMSNLTFNLANVTQRTNACMTVLLVIAALGLVVVWHKRVAA